MITANQLRAARALLNIDQRQMAELADLSVPTIQRMEASDGVVRGNVDLLMKLVSALEDAGIELIGPGALSSTGGRGVRLREQHVAKPKQTGIRGRPRRARWRGPGEQGAHPENIFKAWRQPRLPAPAAPEGPAASRSE